MYNYNCEHAFGVSVDLGGTRISLAIFNLNTEILEFKQIPTYRVETNSEFIKLLVESIKIFILELNLDLCFLKVIGISTPGIIDCKNGIVLGGSPNLPQWENFNLSNEIGEAFKVPVVIENDARAALIGEIWNGRCQKVKNAVLITLSTGVGSALLLDGNIIRGAGNAAGEIGYMLFDRQHLYKNWGDKGCFETLCSGPRIIERVIEQINYISGTNRDITLDPVDNIKENHLVQNLLVDELIDYLSIAILNLVAITNPEIIVLTGVISESSDSLLNRINEKVSYHTATTNSVDIVLSELKELAPLYGISLLGLNAIQPSNQILKSIKII
jgi:predicted NBD/HSP70 family sugar kinase